MACIAGLLLSRCQLSETMGFKFLGFTVVHDPKCLGSTEVDTGVIHWEGLYEP